MRLEITGPPKQSSGETVATEVVGPIYRGGTARSGLKEAVEEKVDSEHVDGRCGRVLRQLRPC